MRPTDLAEALRNLLMAAELEGRDIDEAERIDILERAKQQAREALKRHTD